jgi:hypothetical protein
VKALIENFQDFVTILQIVQKFAFCGMEKSYGNLLKFGKNTFPYLKKNLVESFIFFASKYFLLTNFQTSLYLEMLEF